MTKILQILGSLGRGGAETMIMNYYRELSKSGIQFDFVVHAEFEDDYRAEAQSMGAKLVLLPPPGQAGLMRYIRLLRKAIKENGPYDAVHIHTDAQAFMGVIAARQAGVKRVVVHSHNTHFNKKRLPVNRMIFALTGVTRVACGEKAGERFFGKQKYLVLNNAIPAEKFKNTEEPVAAEGPKVLGHLGRFHVQKNHPFIVEVAGKLKKRNADVRIHLYGAGATEESIRKLVQERQLEDYIRFMGLTNDAPAAYRTMDMFILPSLYEGFPVTLVECQLAGMPTLVSDRISRECDLGLGLMTYLPLDAEVWAEEICRRLADGSCRRQQLSNEVIARYDVAVQWKRLLAIYEGTLKPGK